MLHYHLFFLPATATTELYTLSLHDALPIFERHVVIVDGLDGDTVQADETRRQRPFDAAAKAGQHVSKHSPPLSSRLSSASSRAARSSGSRRVNSASPARPRFPDRAPGRSEERRVGKECRSRWSPEH